MNKKADFNFTVALVLILAAGIILILITSGMIQWFKGFFMGESCQASILKASELRVPVTEERLLPNIDCPVSKILIKLDDVKTKDNKINDTKVKRRIADEIYKCWDKTGRGKLDPYSSYDKDEKYCLICSEINFDKTFLDQQKKENYQLRDLTVWMATNTITGQKMTYYKAIYGREITQEELEKIRESSNNNIVDTESSNVVVWRMDKVGFLEEIGMGILAYFLSSGNQQLYSTYFTNQLAEGISSRVFFVNQKALSEKITIGQNQNQDFCTVIVN